MKQAELFHPRVFSDREWAEGYYKRNARNITMTGKRLADMLKKTGFNGGKILDAGCGFAAVPIEIAKAIPGSEIIGIDLGEPLLELGKSLVDKTGFSKQITLQKGDVQAINFEDNSFDLVINSYMLHIVEEPTTMLNELERVAHPNAKIMITDLRRGFLALMIKKFKTAYTDKEAQGVIDQSELRKGRLSNGPFWWDYMVGF